MMISIPLAVLSSLIVLYFLGDTLNTMTLGGLALAASPPDLGTARLVSQASGSGSILWLDWTGCGWHRPGIGQDEGQKTDGCTS
jgi:hypothetical protein